MEKTNPLSLSHEVLVEVSSATMTTKVTTSTNIGTIATNTAATTSTAATVTRTTKPKDGFDMTCVWILLIFLFGLISLCAFLTVTNPANYDVKFRYGVQVDSSSFLSVSNISYPQTTTEFNMVFSFRNEGRRSNYSLILATMYLHQDHKYLSDKGLHPFVLERNEGTQVKAKFGLSENLLASDLAGGEVIVEAELMFDTVCEINYMESVYFGRFVCSDIKFVNSSSKVGGNWTMLGGTKNCKDVSDY